MLIELFVFFEIVMLAFFATAFFTKNEILWAVTLVLSGFLMFTSFNIELQTYVYNSTINAYQYEIRNEYYPYLMGINMIFFILGMVLMLYDLWAKFSLSNAES
jgi:hypothetical protein